MIAYLELSKVKKNNWLITFGVGIISSKNLSLCPDEIRDARKLDCDFNFSFYFNFFKQLNKVGPKKISNYISRRRCADQNCLNHTENSPNRTHFGPMEIIIFTTCTLSFVSFALFLNIENFPRIN